MPGARRPAFVTADDAVAMIGDGETVAFEGSGGGLLEPTTVIRALADRHIATATPRGLTILFSSGIGDRKGGGLDHLAQPGLVARAIGGHFGMTPALAAAARSGGIEALSLPQGLIAQLYRAIAAGQPGILTHVGLGTYVDPRHGGGWLSPARSADLVRVMRIDDREFLFYPSMTVHTAVIRATTADERGNLTLEQEAARLSVMSVAAAAHNSGGRVIAQVGRVARHGTLAARDVVVPGHLVDVVVVDPDQWQTVAAPYNPSFSGEVRIPLASMERDALPTARRVVGRRAFLELQPGMVVNLGVGMSDAVAVVAAEEGRLTDITLSVEQGLIGGVPAGGVIFGAMWNPDAIIDANLQFDYYDGGGLDCACLGFAEVDAVGNVNVSAFGDRVVGLGGFANITASTPRLVFCGSLTAGGLDVDIRDGKVRILREGATSKFVPLVHQVSFSAQQARERAQQVTYVTERAVFTMSDEGIVLTEVAPGLDVEQDVIAHMGFRPEIASPLREMPAWCFEQRRMDSGSDLPRDDT